MKKLARATDWGVNPSTMKRRRGASPKAKPISRRAPKARGVSRRVGDKGKPPKFAGPAAKASKPRIKTLSPAQVAAKFKAQRAARKEAKQLANAKAARDSYKARKKDRGKLVMIGTKGQRDPQLKGRRGYLVYVTKTGKKWLIKQTGKRKGAFQPRTLKDTEPPARKNLKAATGVFLKARRVQIGKQKSAVKGSGSIKTGGPWDFSDSVVSKIAKSLKKTIESQISHRTFIISVMVLVRLANGTEQTFEFQLPIDKPDHIAIKLAGLKNFVARKFYAFMARELAYAGYVTAGSSNHIRSLKQNKGLDREEWMQKDGEMWRGNESEVVTILKIDWKIEQAI